MREMSGNRTLSNAVQNGNQDSLEVIANKYKILRTLGSGVSGFAFLALDLRCKIEQEKQKVVKKIYVGTLQLEETVTAAQEGNMLKSLSHPNILKYYDSFINKDFYCIVTEFCDEGDLDSLIQEFRESKKIFREKLVLEWLIQILSAVQYIHLRNILHRDLKTKNIFLKNNRVKVGDFGIAKILMNPVDMAETFVGTPYYMSPEALKHEGYNSKSDIWSIGCILYDLVALDHPFKGSSLMSVMYKITEGPPPQWPGYYSTQLKNVFLRLIEKDPSKRPSATDVLSLPYISQHRQEALNTTVQNNQTYLNTTTMVKKDRQKISQNIQSKAKLVEMQKDAEEKFIRNLPPRDRMRVMRQKKADAEAQKLKTFVAEHHKEAQAEYAAIRKSLNPYQSNVSFWGEKKFNENSSNIRSPNQATAKSLKEKKHVLYEATSNMNRASTDRIDSSSDESNPSPRQNYMRWTTAFEEQPVTPMKDLSIYKINHNSSSFDDGIPENPELAETYYGQFDEFTEDSDGNSEDSFINSLQTALSTAEKTITKKT